MKKLIICILLINSFIIFAKDHFYVDYSCFRTTDMSKARTDIYISIPVMHLEFNEDLTSIFSIKVFVYDGDKLIAEDKWKKRYTINKKNDKYSGAEIPALSNFDLPTGYFKLVVIVKDLIADKELDRLEVPQESKLFKIAGFKDRFSVSSIQLASKIITEGIEKSSEFYKQGVIILPNPSKIYGTARPFLYFYTELYGLNKNEEIEYIWTIFDSEGKEIKKGKPQLRTSNGTTYVIADKATVPSLRTGAYDLKLNIKNKTTGKVIEGGNNFYIYRKIDFVDNKFKLPGHMKDSLSISGKDSIELDVMKDDELLAEFDQVFNTLDKKEQNKYKGLFLNGKRNFLKRYWTAKEIERKEQENAKGKNDYITARNFFKLLVEKCNSEFSTNKVEGWKTARGKVFLRFGSPDKRDIETYNNEYADHEIWTYFKGNYTFVFADIHGLGDFKLIHSDYPGEKYDPNWKSKVEKSKF